MRKIYFLVVTFFISSNLLAGYLIENAKIVKIGSTNWNDKVFYVKTRGGSGLCEGKTIIFPQSYAQSQVAYNQMHSMAVTAFVANETVSIYNYSDRKYRNGDRCTGANRIDLIR